MLFRSIIKSLELTEPKRIIPSLANSFTIYLCINGEANIKTTYGQTYELKQGECILIPAGMEDFLLNTGTKEKTFLLEVAMPTIMDTADSYIENNIDQN